MEALEFLDEVAEGFEEAANFAFSALFEVDFDGAVLVCGCCYRDDFGGVKVFAFKFDAFEEFGNELEFQGLA